MRRYSARACCAVRAACAHVWSLYVFEFYGCIVCIVCGRRPCRVWSSVQNLNDH